MKLNFGRRFVLFVHWLLSLAACALGVALFVWPECRATAASLLKNTDVLIYAITVLVVYLLFAAGTVTIILGGRKRGKDGDFIVVDSGETGRTRIAVSAVEQMIRQAVRGVSGIADMKAAIVNKDDSIAINVDLTLLSGTHVPTVTANIRRAIRGYIEQNCGVAVHGVSVSVHSLAEVEEAGGRRGRKKKTEVGKTEEQTPVWNHPVESYRPVERPVSAPSVVPDEPAVAREPEEPIRLTLDPEPVAREIAEPEPVIAPEPAAEAEAEAAAEPEKAESAPRKGKFFGKLFGKREAPAAEETPAEETPAEETPAEEAPVAEAAEGGDAYAGEWSSEDGDAFAADAADSAEEAEKPEDDI